MLDWELQLLKDTPEGSTPITPAFFSLQNKAESEDTPQFKQSARKHFIDTPLVVDRPTFSPSRQAKVMLLQAECNQGNNNLHVAFIPFKTDKME